MLARPSGAAGEACSDGVDNDGDQKIDFPADPGCASATDQSEGPTCPPVSGVLICLAPGSLFQRFEVVAPTPGPPGPPHRVAGWVDQYRFTVAGVTTTVPCVGLAVDAAGANPCALAGGTFVTRVATLLDQTVSEPGIQLTPIVTIDVCNAELTVTAANNGINSAPAYAPCEPLGPGQDDCGTGSDAGNSHASASSISLPKSNCFGSLPPGDEDWYQFSVTSGRVIDASMTPLASSDFGLCLYDPSGNQVSCGAAGTGATDSVSYAATVSGNWRLRVITSAGNAGGHYTLSASTAPHNDCGTGSDAGNSHTGASSISLPKSNCSGSLPSGDEDWYQFPVTSGYTIDASMTPNAGSNFDICIYDPSGWLVAGCTAGSAGSTDTLTHTASTTGNYRLRVKIGWGSGSYAMSVATTAPPQDDCGTGSDAGGSHADASLILLPKSDCAGSLVVSTDTQDWYQFSVTSGYTVNASMRPNASSDFGLCLHDPSGNQVSCSTAGTGATDSISYAAMVTGSWRLRVFVSGSSAGGSYTMSVSTTPTPDDCGTGSDAGNSHAAASSISLPKSNCSGSLVVSTDTQDWYQFSVTSGETIDASMTPNASSDFDVCLYDPSGNQVTCSTAGTGATDSISHTASVSGNWRFQINIYSSSPGGSYTMSVSTTAPPTQDDCGIGSDAGNSHASASSISLPKSNCFGSLPPGDEDWYQFSVTSGYTIDASMTPLASSDFGLCLYDPSGNQVACSAAGTGATGSISYATTTTGSWRVRVFSSGSSAGGNYTMSVSTAPTYDDCGIGSDAGNSHTSASSISLPKSNCSASLPPSDEDWYQFPVTSGETFNASMTPNADSNFDICIYDPSGWLVAGCTAGSAGSTDTLTHTATTTGNYRLRVRIWFGSGSYTMSVSMSSGVIPGGSGIGAPVPCRPTQDCAYKQPDEDHLQAN